MIFTQYYLDCLSQASYLIGDETSGRAVVVDPRRDIAEYVSDAAAAGLTIKLVIETHFRADFLSGHLELAAATGDVGRPDLLSSIGVTREELADQLYDSLHNKLMTLPDATRVYPAHGAGSACGKNLSTDTSSTIGEQRISHDALLAENKQVFFDLVTEGQPPAPNSLAR
jgi:glyoxylase-like metal-dependent hydrolase (beta-lactamase superfamily II)